VLVLLRNDAAQRSQVAAQLKNVRHGVNPRQARGKALARCYHGFDAFRGTRVSVRGLAVAARERRAILQFGNIIPWDHELGGRERAALRWQSIAQPVRVRLG
jgi:hypothetical protein